MSNHVHLLVTPDEVGALSRLMHTFARNHAGLFNGRHGRTGTSWEGRYKASLVDSSHYFLVCSRYIELNPVRAWMVSQPDDWPWSSHAAHVGTRTDPLLTLHAEYVALGVDAAARAEAYRAMFADALPDELIKDIRRHLQQQKALGSDQFCTWVEARTGRFAAVRSIGRPSTRPNCP